MKSAAQFHLALVTAPDRKTARLLARRALQARAAACANLIDKIESRYWWKGKMESASEILIIFKTTKQQLRRLETVILENHPYDTPEFVALPLSGGNESYLAWLAQSVKSSSRRIVT